MHRLLLVLMWLSSLSWLAGAQSPQPYLNDRLSQVATTHLVEPGDTWASLTLRYGVPVADLQAAAGHLNSRREPAIGATLPLPPYGAETRGALLRMNEGGLLATAVQSGTSPWQLALANGLPSPYQPGLWRPLLLPGDQPVRELPGGVAAIALTPEAPVPGQALAGHFRLRDGEVRLAVALDGLPWAVTVQDDNAVAVGGTGAFAAPGQPELSVQAGTQPVWRQPWVVADRDWVFQQLTLTGDAAAIDQASIQAERERLAGLWSQVTPAAQWNAPFRLPIADYLEVSADYGARRSYNGGPYRSYHEGTDFSAYAGTPVTAPAAGTVVLAEPLFVRGGAVIVDHGLGIFTGYYHLSSVLATPGQRVEPGDILGEVGTTGLSTGNHLHWDLIVNSTWVDAMRWLEADTACWLLDVLGSACQAPPQP
jgi:murein DD-endopeptidase MepM/ murein hydrolase activator NlpD